MSSSGHKKQALDTLYYDGACPVCSAEINKLSTHTKHTLILQDIHQLDDTLTPPNTPNKSQLLSRLHMRTQEGEWLVGIDANIRAWQNTPYRYIWQVLGWPVIRIFTQAAYELWLRLRK